jgi:hypothetical protein
VSIRKSCSTRASAPMLIRPMPSSPCGDGGPEDPHWGTRALGECASGPNHDRPRGRRRGCRHTSTMRRPAHPIDLHPAAPDRRCGRVGVRLLLLRSQPIQVVCHSRV